MKSPALQIKWVGVLQMAFWTREVFETYEKQAPFRAELTRFIDGMTDRVAISGKWLAP